MQFHPIISTYCETQAASFPLILCVGREPNAERSIKNCLGHYDFKCVPRCGFWNLSYSLVGSSVGLSAKEFKRVCHAQGASPLVYADALPIAIRDSTKNKRAIRAEVPAETWQQHIDDLFSHRDILDRVAVVLLSGLNRNVFAEPAKLIRQNCNRRQIFARDVPFFHGCNAKVLRTALDAQSLEMIASIATKFLHADLAHA